MPLCHCIEFGDTRPRLLVGEMLVFHICDGRGVDMAVDHLGGSGCLCCTIHTSLVDTLRRLFDKRRDGSIPAFNRVLVETTGLADPAPIIHTLMNNSFVRHHFKLDCIITTVYVVHGVQEQFQRLLLNEWPSADRRSKLVLITRDLDRTIVSKWLQPDTLFDG